MKDSDGGKHGARFEFVDGLRGLAALGVVLPHVLGLFAHPQQRGLSSFFLYLAGFGRAGVEVFFVVSGFAIAYSMRNTSSEKLSLGRFILRRAVRLDPPYWAAMLWVAFVEVFRASVTHNPIVLPSLGKVIAHLLYLQDILGLGQFNPVFWTLCLEFQLYLLFAIMMRVATAFAHERQAKSRIWRESDEYGWLMVIAFLASLVVSHTVWPLLPGWFVPYLYMFLSGSLAAWLALERISERLFRLCLLIMGLAFLLRPEQPRAAALITALMLYAAIRRAALHRWLAVRPAQWLGRISYPIYLIHVPLVTIFLGLGTRLGADSPWVSLGLLAGLYAATLALASLLHAVVEVPSIRLSQQLKRRRPLVDASVYSAPPG